MLEISGVVLPDGGRKTIRIHDGKIAEITDAPPSSGELWLLPGLVDVHTHPGTEKPRDIFEEDTYRKHMLDHLDAGVLLVRSPGSADPDSSRVRQDADLPRLCSGGRWLATPGTFFPGFGRDVTYAGLAAAAVEEARASSGWCKIIGDWLPGTPAVPVDVLTEAVAAVHEIGGRVSVHTQTAEGGRNAVAARADSIEHGMHLEHELLPQMAEQGIALVPTLTAIANDAEKAKTSTAAEHVRNWIIEGWAVHKDVALAAHEAGVTVLAGTDAKPCGQVVGEIEWLVSAGIPVETAVGAGSWTARSWLGLPGLTEGAPADIVAYAADPRLDPSVLHAPQQIVLGGRVIR